MGWTNFPKGVMSMGIPTFGSSGLPPFTGNYFFVQETYTAGSAAGNGTAAAPFNTLAQALASCVAGNDDVIFLSGTVHVTSAIAWNKNNTHLVGVCGPLQRGKRARISCSGSTPFSNLVNVTANGCYFTNFGTFYGFPTTAATSPVCWVDSGGRNTYDNVELLGFCDATMTTGTANQTTARAMVISGTTGEITMRSCVFGVDTVVRNATNYTLEIAGFVPRLTFEDCDFEADLGSAGGASSHVLIGASGLDRYSIMKRCRFMNAVKTGATTMTQVMNVASTANGGLLLDQCTGFGATHWETTPSSCVLVNMPAVASHDSGLAIADTTS